MSHSSSPNPRAPFPVTALIAIGVLALLGVAFLVWAIVSIPNATLATPAPATPVALAPTSAIVLPTVTAPLPSPTPEPTTAVPPTAPAEATPTTDTGPRLTISVGANVRSGPGTNYPILGGVAGGESLSAIGRDASAQWFVIAFAGAANGQGWVSSAVATYSGDVNGLPVIAAPPLPATVPPPTATQSPATNTPVVQGSRGVVGESFSFEATTGMVGQLMWFNFKVTNTSNAAVSYSVLAAHSESGPSAKSWSNQTLQPKETLIWRDHLAFSATGTYRVYLGICYGGFEACMANQSTWDRLSPSVSVVIQ